MHRRHVVASGSVVVGAAIVLLLALTVRPALAADNVSLFAPDSNPDVASFADTTAYDLGVRFTSDVDGEVTGVRFYKGSQNTGPHTGSLWASDGTLLASAPFTDETASGWQAVAFAAPVPISAGTTYVASYHTTVGFYSVNVDGFASGLDAGPLHVPAGGGAFRFGAGFPDQASQHNYWVDVVVVPSPPPSSESTGPPPTTATSTSTSVTTTSTTSSTSSSTAPGAELPVTGANAGFLAGAGAVILIAGIAILGVARRRRDHSEPASS
jgi:LPXTG-motif cell wall-anchored protein